MKHNLTKLIFRISVALNAAVLVFMLTCGLASAETVGVILTGDTPFYRDINKAFTEALKAQGMGDVEVLTQSPAPNKMAWVNAARKLVAIDADIIVTYGAPATQAVLREVSGKPVVFAGVYDPEGLGIKGSNVTGISSTVPVAGVLKNLKGIKPFTNLGVVYNSEESDTVLQAKEVAKLEKQLAFKSQQFNIRRIGDASKIQGVDALFITTSCSAHQCVNDIVGLARRDKLPTSTMVAGGSEHGIILTVSPVPAEQGQKAAEMVGKILKGAKPSSIPMEKPRKIEMIINLKEATQIGLKIPIDILTSASGIIK